MFGCHIVYQETKVNTSETAMPSTASNSERRTAVLRLLAKIVTKTHLRQSAAVSSNPAQNGQKHAHVKATPNATLEIKNGDRPRP